MLTFETFEGLMKWLEHKTFQDIKIRRTPDNKWIVYDYTEYHIYVEGVK